MLISLISQPLIFGYIFRARNIFTKKLHTFEVLQFFYFAWFHKSIYLGFTLKVALRLYKAKLEDFISWHQPSWKTRKHHWQWPENSSFHSKAVMRVIFTIFRRKKLKSFWLQTTQPKLLIQVSFKSHSCRYFTSLGSITNFPFSDETLCKTN